jgi:hypothetical protein
VPSADTRRAPSGVNGLSSWASGSAAPMSASSFAAAAFTGPSNPPGAAKTMLASVPARVPKPPAVSRSAARWLPVPGRLKSSLVSPEATDASTVRPASSTTHTASTRRRER